MSGKFASGERQVDGGVDHRLSTATCRYWSSSCRETSHYRDLRLVGYAEAWDGKRRSSGTIDEAREP